MRLLIALSLLTAIGVAAPAALAAGSGGIGVRLVDVPADSRHDPLAGSYIVDRLAPGTSIRRRIEITNSTASPVTVAVYPAAADLRQGRFAFAAARTPNELSSWTSVSRPLLRVPAGTRTFETVTIAVPKQASHGERHAVVWAEVSAPAASGVTLVNRVGVRMYIATGPGGAAPASFAIGSLSAERSDDGAPLVVAIVHNTGGATLDLVGTLTLADGPGDLRAGPFRVHVAQAVVPGDSASATVHLDARLPRGPWTARLRLRSGDVERASTAVIVFPPQTGSAVPPADDAERSPLVAALVVILLALFAIVLLALLLGRRVRPSRGGGVGPAVPAGS